MPAFVFISGYFSKKVNLNIFELSKKILIPLVIFQIFYSFVLQADALLIKPVWILWYLLCLFVWKISLPYLLKLKHPVLFSFTLSLAAGLLNFIGYNFSLSRLIYFLPFFLMGYLVSEKKYRKIFFGERILWLAAAFILLILIVVLNSIFNINVKWLYGSYSYAFLNVGFIAGIIYRIYIYIASISIGLVFFNLVSRQNKIYSELGKRSLYVYLLHGFIIIIFREYLVKYLKLDNIWIELPALLLLSLAITILLSSNLAKKLTRFCIEPNLG